MLLNPFEDDPRHISLAAYPTERNSWNSGVVQKKVATELLANISDSLSAIVNWSGIYLEQVWSAERKHCGLDGPESNWGLFWETCVEVDPEDKTANRDPI